MAFKLTEQDLLGLYDLIKGDRHAQAEVWSALEAYRSGDLAGCRDPIQSVFSRVGGSLQETAKETVDDRAKKIVEKMAAGQGKAYGRVATRDALAKAKAKAEQQVEKARRIVGAFESVLSKLTSALTVPIDSPVKASGGENQHQETPTEDAGDAIVDADSPEAARRIGVGIGEPTDDARTALSAAIDAFITANNADEARRKLAEYFDVQTLDDRAMIQPGALFHLHGGTRGNFVRVSSIEKGNVQLEKPHSGERYKSVVPIDYFLATGSKGESHLLAPKLRPSSASAEVSESSGLDDREAPSHGRQDAAVTRASFQMLVSDIGRAQQKLQVFSNLHKVSVSLHVDTRAIIDADRGSFRKGDTAKARQQVEMIMSQVGAAVNSARATVQRREQEFRQCKEKTPGSERRPMESCFAPTYLALHAVEKALRNLVQGLDAALCIEQDN